MFIRFRLFCSCVSEKGLSKCIRTLLVRGMSVCVQGAVLVRMTMSIMWPLNAMLTTTFIVAGSSRELCFKQASKSRWSTCVGCAEQMAWVRGGCCILGRAD